MPVHSGSRSVAPRRSPRLLQKATGEDSCLTLDHSDGRFPFHLAGFSRGTIANRALYALVPRGFSRLVRLDCASGARSVVLHADYLPCVIAGRFAALGERCFADKACGLVTG